MCVGYKLQQEHLHSTNNRHDRLSPVPRNAAALYQQGPCIHLGVLRIEPAESGGATPHLGADQGTEGARPDADPRHVGGQQV